MLSTFEPVIPMIIPAQTLRRLLPVAIASLAVAASASAQVEHQLLDPDLGPNEILNSFGKSVSVSGSRVLVASGRGPSVDLKSHIFEPQEDGSWTEVEMIGGGASVWNHSVSLDNDRALTGDPGYSAFLGAPVTGAAYVYDRQHDGSWVRSATLVGDDVPGEASMGLSVSMDGDRALVGAPGGRDHAGAAYLFERQGNATWTQVAKLTPEGAGARRQFGWFVSLSGDRALVGCQGGDEGTSFSDYCVPRIFERQGDGSWAQTARLISPDAPEENQNAVHGKLDDDRVVIGQGLIIPPQTFNSPRTSVFERQGDGSWAQVGRLIIENVTHPTMGPLDMDGDRVILGTHLVTLGGAAYIFERQPGGSWIQSRALTTSESLNENFGWSVGLDGDVAVVGIFGLTEHAAYVYTGVTATSADDRRDLPETAVLRSAYPNPFNPRVTIPFSVPVSRHVSIKIFDVLGRTVAALVDAVLPAGEHVTTWEPAQVAGGAYLVVMDAGATRDSRLVVLQK